MRTRDQILLSLDCGKWDEGHLPIRLILEVLMDIRETICKGTLLVDTRGTARD